MTNYGHTKKLNRKKTNPLNFEYTGVQYEKDIAIQLFEYNKDQLTEVKNISDSEFTNFSNLTKQYWLNIHGIHHVEIIENICKKIGIHHLAIQDILDVNQRPKFQKYDDYWFFSIKSMLPSKTNNIKSEQISFILGENFLVSFQERKANHFEHIRRRLREKVGIIHEQSADYLLYLLLESILDNYFKTIDKIEDEVDAFNILELNSDPSPTVLKEIEVYKNQIYSLKKTISPIKEFILIIEREEFNLINQQHIKYYLELKDLCLTLLDNCTKLEERLESNINFFFSVQGHRMNQVMKTLTVVSSIFIPLTFIAGVYGMNFMNMPELNSKWGYFVVLGVMLAIFLMMLHYFKKKNWF